MIRLVILLLLFGTCAYEARAHKTSDSYLTFDVGPRPCTGQWDIALRDLAQVLPLDSNKVESISVAELKKLEPAIQGYAFSHLSLRCGTEGLALKHGDISIVRHSDGAYAILPFTFEPPRSSNTVVEVKYDLFFAVDPLHRGLFRIIDGTNTETSLFDPAHRTALMDLSQEESKTGALAFLNEGIWHIWTGYDHILFLLALLLPAVFTYREKKWQVVTEFRPAFLNVLKVVTAFTVAHSITLTLAATGTLTLPSKWIEVAIAFSVALAALNNLYPLFRESAWMVAFAFGLIHGFGFAGALKDLGLTGGSLAWALVSFNLGVEAGQFAILAVLVPIGFLLRRTWFYRGVVLRFGSAAIALIAITWMCERLFDFKVLAF